MRPSVFPQATGVRTAPKGMEDTVSPLPVYSDGQQCISLWKASLFDRLKILLTGRIWLSVMSGHAQPPVCVQAAHIFGPSPESKAFGRLWWWYAENVFYGMSIWRPLCWVKGHVSDSYGTCCRCLKSVGKPAEVRR